MTQGDTQTGDLPLAPKRSANRALGRIGLSAIVLAYFICVLRLSPSALFGTTHDDTLYFSSAKALATGQGYTLPSVPGRPAATKYPILYSWLLSWVWRANPSFPSNLRGAKALTAAFGALFVVGSYVFIRGLAQTVEAESLLLTLFVALHPIVTYYSASILSDVPFAALALAAIILGEKALRPEASAMKALICSLVTGLSVLMRIFGVPIAAGLLLAALMRRAWRQAALFSAGMIPFGMAALWQSFWRASSIAPNAYPYGKATSGFADEWLYYTNYLGFWRRSVPDTRIFWAMVRDNAVYLLRSPADFFLAPHLTQGGIASTALMLLITLAILAGILRMAKRQGWQPVHYALVFYAALTVVWNFSNSGRFLFLFLPLFAVALWTEARHFLGLCHKAVTAAGANRLGEKLLACAFAAGLMAIGIAVVWNGVRGVQSLAADTSGSRAALLLEKREAYEWLACCTTATDIAIAYEDASLFLYSGRQGLRPAVFPTSGKYDPGGLQQSLAHLTDVAQTIGAKYWLISDDDFSMEWAPVPELGRAREGELEKALPLVFQSRGGHIRIYRIGCSATSRGQGCP